MFTVCLKYVLMIMSKFRRRTHTEVNQEGKKAYTHVLRWRRLR